MPLSTSRFTRLAFTGALSRQPDADELADWTGALDPLIESPASLLLEARSLLSALFLSSEYVALSTTDAAFVTDVYLAYLGRVPEASEQTAGEAAVSADGRTAFLTSAGQLSDFSARVSSLYAEPSASVDPFPVEALGGPHPSKRRSLPPDYKSLSAKHKYVDGGISLNTTGDVPLLRWEEDYSDSLLSETEIAVLRDHYNRARHEELVFDYTDPDGILRTGVRYESYDDDFIKTWINSAKIVLVKYPS